MIIKSIYGPDLTQGLRVIVFSYPLMRFPWPVNRITFPELVILPLLMFFPLSHDISSSINSALLNALSLNCCKASARVEAAVSYPGTSNILPSPLSRAKWGYS